MSVAHEYVFLWLQVPAVDAESSVDVQTLGYQKDDDDIQGRYESHV